MKDTFYFPHDYNASMDEKIIKLLSKHGLAGYGCFWRITESLYNNSNELNLDYDRIAYELHTVDIDLVKSVINDFGLFRFEGDCFGSASIERRLCERNEKSEKARQSVLKRWNKIKTDTIVLKADTTVSKSDTIKERKERKENDIKTWKNDFQIYLKECSEAYKKFREDPESLKTQERLNPGINVSLSIEKGYINFWSTEAGWKHKKKSRCEKIDWKATIINSIDLNKVYLKKDFRQHENEMNGSSIPVSVKFNSGSDK